MNNIESLQKNISGYVAENNVLSQQNEQTISLQPLFSGSNIKIATTSDFEKLLASLKGETENNKLEVAKGMLSNTLKTMLGLAEGLSADQRANLTLLEIKTKQLEQLVEAMRTTKEDREKLIRDKEAAKTEEEKAIIDEKIKALDDKLSTINTDLESVQNEINAITKALDSRSLGILFSAIRLTFSDVVNLTEKEEEISESDLTIAAILTQALNEATSDMITEIQKQKIEMA